MCRTIHALASTIICTLQMLVRVFLATVLMVENVFRMLLQTLYNFISFMLQMISLLPICLVFIVTARLRCFMCGGGGPCPVNRGGACDCLMSLFAIVIIFLIFRATGVLDRIFNTIGYAKATTSHVARFAAKEGEVTECSSNDTDTEYIFYPVDTTTEEYEDVKKFVRMNEDGEETDRIYIDTETMSTISVHEEIDSSTVTYIEYIEETVTFYDTSTDEFMLLGDTDGNIDSDIPFTEPLTTSDIKQSETDVTRWTTILYYLV